MRRRIAHLALLAIVVSPVAGASASSDFISFSSDGVDFGPTLTEPLFSDDLRWVPGDVREATVYVRNDSDGPAVMSFDAAGEAAPDRPDDGFTVDFAPSEPAQQVDVDEAVPVTVRVTYLPTSTESAEGRIGDIVLRVNASEDSAVAGVELELDDPPGADGTDDSTGSEGSSGAADSEESGAVAGVSALLPDTGGEATGVLLLALGVIAAGTSLIFARRPRSTEGSTHV